MCKNVGYQQIRMGSGADAMQFEMSANAFSKNVDLYY